MEKFEEQAASVLETIQREKTIYKNYLSDNAINAGNHLVRIIQNLADKKKDAVLELFKNEIPYEYPYMAVWWYSVLLGMQKEGYIYKDFISFVRTNGDSFSPNTLYFLFYQLAALGFHFSELINNDTRVELWKLCQEIVERFEKMISVPLNMVSEDRRNHNIVVVITEQFLATDNGPTKTALDRCKILMTALGKEVVLINTAEIVSSVCWIVSV